MLSSKQEPHTEMWGISTKHSNDDSSNGNDAHNYIYIYA